SPCRKRSTRRWAITHTTAQTKASRQGMPCRDAAESISYASNALRHLDHLVLIAGHHPREVTHRDVFAEEVHGSVAVDEVGATRVEAIGFASSLRDVIGVRLRGRTSLVVAVGAVDRAGTRQGRSVVRRAVNAEVARRPHPAASVDDVRRNVADLLPAA